MRLRVLLVFCASVDLVFIIVAVYQQPLVVNSGLAVGNLGWFYAVGTLFAAAGPVTITWVSARWGIFRTLGVSGLALAVGCAAIFVSPGLWVMIPLVAVRPMIQGSRLVAIEAMNRLAGADERATVLSLRGIASAAVAGPVQVMSGVWADRMPLRQLFLALGMALPAVLGTLGWFWRKSAGEEEAQ